MFYITGAFFVRSKTYWTTTININNHLVQCSYFFAARQPVKNSNQNVFELLFDINKSPNSYVVSRTFQLWHCTIILSIFVRAWKIAGSYHYIWLTQIKLDIPRLVFPHQAFNFHCNVPTCNGIQVRPQKSRKATQRRPGAAIQDDSDNTPWQ